MNFSTPARASPLSLSSLLADFTPNTHTWSRLKAALSVHRKGMLSCNTHTHPPYVLTQVSFVAHLLRLVTVSDPYNPSSL